VGCLLTKHAPRGKGWMPRTVGRLLGWSQRPVMHTAYDARLAVDTCNLDVYTTLAVAPAPPAADVLLGCASTLAPGGVLFDVGASAGNISIEMLELFGPSISVCAFEPQPSLARAAAISAELNGFATMSVFELMVGEKDGTGALYVGAHAVHASAVPREPDVRKLRSPMISLDRLIADGGAPAPTVIAVDVEGAEHRVFLGAAATLREYRPTLVFKSDKNTDRFGYRRADLLRILRDLAGYRFFGIAEGAFVPEPADGTLGPYENLLAVAPDRPVPAPRRLEGRRHPAY
jgi:FkbM family methyltransferase